MEMSQGNSLYSYRKQTKMSFFKKREQEGKTGSVWGVSISGRGDDIRKGCRRVNILEILCSHVCKWKNEIC
jgi:hypothetical protein